MTRNETHRLSWHCMACSLPAWYWQIAVYSYWMKFKSAS